ncbi:MAG: methylenetetrahydrofolate reductase [NAD(P)H] [Candidatus Hydrogenedentota bacterium]
MNLAEMYAQDQLTISFELFPPKTEKGMENLFHDLKELVACGPSFITCTYGAGGSTHERTLMVLRRIIDEHPGIPVASHLTCAGATEADLRDYLQQAAAMGVRFVVALRGDPPQGEKDFVPTDSRFRYGEDLVRFIREEFPQFGIAVGGYPETHPEAPSRAKDMQHLKRKVDAGADAVITQLFYDNCDFYRFRDRCEREGIHVPIIPGVLPVVSLPQITKIATMCGANLPPKLLERLEAQTDEEGQFLVGLYYATRQVEELVEQGVPGVHFYVLNKSRAAAFICRALNLSQRADGAVRQA